MVMAHGSETQQILGKKEIDRFTRIKRFINN